METILKNGQLRPTLGTKELIFVFVGLSLILLLWFFDKTDIPFIQNLPHVPAVPIFGNLFQLGTEHPKRLAALSRRYGPVFQIRLGNRVRILLPLGGGR